MRRLILMRHAKSAWDDPYLSDFDRPLNERGQRSAIALGDWLRREGHLPNHALVSSAQRTGETFQGLRLGLKPDYRRDLYHAPAAKILLVLQAQTATTILLIAHNPGIGDCAERLLSTTPDHPRFLDYPTGATLIADFAIDTWAALTWHSGTCTDFIVPRELTD